MNAYIFQKVKYFVSFKSYWTLLFPDVNWWLIPIAFFLSFRVQGLSSENQEHDVTCPFPLQLNTSAVYFYRYLEIPVPVKLVSRILFEAKSSKDVHISLTPSKNSTDFYEIVIGAGTNTFSTIRRCKLCADLSFRATANYLNSDEFRRFWITFGNAGSITVGKNEEELPFLEWTDPNPLEINYMGYSTGWKSAGEFRFCNFGVSFRSTPSTEALTDAWSPAISRVESSTPASNKTVTTHCQPEQPSKYPDTKRSGTVILWLIAAIFVLLFILSAAIYLMIRRKHRGNRGKRKTKDRTYQLQGGQLSSSNNEGSNMHMESNETLNISSTSVLVDTNEYQTNEDFKPPSYVSYAKVLRHPENKEDSDTDGTIYNDAYESYNIRG